MHTRVLPWVLALVVFLSCLPGVVFAATHLSESGSTLLYPLMNVWVKQYEKVHPEVDIVTAATGSGAGIAEAKSGDVHIGASDAYVPEGDTQPRMLSIPLAVSAQQINYNVPELRGAPLKLSGAVLAGMYDGSIETWDDKRIAALNPGVALPKRKIVPVRRSEGSGDTFLFTQYLALSSPAWDKQVHFGTTVQWPTNGKMLEAKGNAGVVQVCKDQPGSIAYVGISFLEQAKSEGLATAALQNRSGEFVLPTDTSIRAAVQAGARNNIKDAHMSLAYLPGHDAYPIVNFEYAIVRQQQSSSDVAQALKGFLSWVVDSSGGNKAELLEPVHFVALPTALAQRSRAQIAEIAAAH